MDCENIIKLFSRLFDLIKTPILKGSVSIVLSYALGRTKEVEREGFTAARAPFVILVVFTPHMLFSPPAEKKSHGTIETEVAVSPLFKRPW